MMLFKQIAAGLILFYAIAIMAADSQLEQSEENPEAMALGEIDDSESSDSVTAATATESADEEESPGRFVPTEQISQDLGVSFPVDI